MRLQGRIAEFLGTLDRNIGYASRTVCLRQDDSPPPSECYFMIAPGRSKAPTIPSCLLGLALTGAGLAADVPIVSSSTPPSLDGKSGAFEVTRSDLPGKLRRRPSHFRKTR